MAYRQADATKPLAGMLVVALEQAVAAPLATCRLADAGARVIKIERPEGDFARFYDRDANGQSSYFVWLNRGKQSLVLDLKQPDDLALMRRLLAAADVFVHNLAPGAVDRLGLGHESLCEAHPGLISCAIAAYGADGPFSQRKGYDLLIQAESGLSSVTGTRDAPGRVGVSACDIATGLNAYSAILEAIIGRSTSGRGRSLNLSLFDSMAEWMTVPLLQYESTGVVPPRVGLSHVSIAPYGVYCCGDGLPLLIAVQNQREWRNFCTLVLREADFAAQGRFADNVARVAHRGALDAAISAAFAAMSRSEAIDRLTSAAVAYGMVNDVGGLSAHPHLRRISVNTPKGPVTLPEPVLASSREFGAVPALGEHDDVIRREFR